MEATYHIGGKMMAFDGSICGIYKATNHSGEAGKLVHVSV